MLEGTISRVPPQGGRKFPNQECWEIDTTNILFIGGGSFEGIELQVKDRFKKKTNINTIGFNTNNTYSRFDINTISLKQIRQNINRDDLKRFGMIPELLGRFNILTNLLPLEKQDMINILKLKTGYVEEYKTLFELQDKKLEFEDGTLNEIAEISMFECTGARGLKTIIETILMEIMFNAPSSKQRKYIITKEDVINNYKKEIIVA
jgi:ATP-dependent Clp protease ATP-binding subunit ClpX